MAHERKLDEEVEEVFILRRHNRALRSVNKSLRKLRNHSQEHTDEIFLALCDSDKEAELAMEKLRTLGEFDCDPGDYDFVVAGCLDALGKTQAIDQSSSE